MNSSDILTQKKTSLSETVDICQYLCPSPSALEVHCTTWTYRRFGVETNTTSHETEVYSHIELVAELIIFLPRAAPRHSYQAQQRVA